LICADIIVFQIVLEMNPDSLRSSIAGLLSSRRVLVLGPSGAGKTHFTVRLSALLGLEAVHLDAHFWKPGWISTPQAEWRGKVTALAGRESWIMDGTYESTLDVRIPRADAVILIEDRRWTCLFRALRRRIVADREVRPDAPPGQKFDGAFLRYIWKYSQATKPIIMQELQRRGPGMLTVALHGQRDIRRLIRGIESRTGNDVPD
jgi:adenylate kinase family enzyme